MLIRDRISLSVGTTALTARPTLALLHLDGQASAFGEEAVSPAKPLTKKKEMVVQGSLAASDPRDRVRQNSPHKVHTLALTARETFTIDLVSTEFDAFLRLEDAGAKELASDDDGGFPNARIVFRAPETGDYRIIATSFDGKAGKYTLSIREGNKANSPSAKTGPLPRRQPDGSLHWTWDAGKV